MLSKCKEYFFIISMTSRINYSLLFMLIKMNVQKELWAGIFTSSSLMGHIVFYLYMKHNSSFCGD
jgi:Trk-type K+ transport system membrane component